MGANTTVNTNCHQYFSELSQTSMQETNEQKELIKYIKNINAPLMQIDCLQGQFLAFFTKAIGAKSVLEIGSFVGYSTLWFAHALPENGKLVSCDINQEWSARAKQAFITDRVDHKIEQIIQPALTSLDDFINFNLKNAEKKLFDLIFIDADKSSYPIYFEKCLKLLSDNGTIIIDNIWWHGEVINNNNQQKRTKVLRQFNQDLAKDSRISISYLPLGDGMGLIKKK